MHYATKIALESEEHTMFTIVVRDKTTLIIFRPPNKPPPTPPTVLRLYYTQTPITVPIHLLHNILRCVFVLSIGTELPLKGMWWWWWNSLVSLALTHPHTHTRVGYLPFKVEDRL